MVIRTTRVLSAVVAMLAFFVGVQPTACQAWSILHPLTFDNSPDTKTKKPAPKPPAQPLTFDKVVNTITGKKPAPKPTASTYAYAKPPTIQPPKNESKSWFGSMFQPEDKKPKTVNDWLAQEHSGSSSIH